MFLKHKAFFKIWTLSQNKKFTLYLKHELVEFDKILRSKCKIDKEIHFVEEIFSILYGIFSIKWAIYM